MILEALSRDFLRVCELAAVEAARTMGQGERKHSDHVAVEAMRREMDNGARPLSCYPTRALDLGRLHRSGLSFLTCPAVSSFSLKPMRSMRFTWSDRLPKSRRFGEMRPSGYPIRSTTLQCQDFPTKRAKSFQRHDPAQSAKRAGWTGLPQQP